MAKKILRNVLTFLAIFLVVNAVFGYFAGPSQDTGSVEPIRIVMGDDEYGRGAHVTASLENNTDKDFVIPNECPGEPLDVFTYKNSQWGKVEAKPEVTCDAGKEIIVKAKSKLVIDYANWNHALFGENGRYKVSVKTPPAAGVEGATEKTVESPEFTVVNPSIWRTLWMTVFYQPIYNVLVFLTAKIPGHDLGFAIIALTILIRIILLAPSQKALKSQKKMQELQPKLEAIKEKHKGNQQMISMETMALWKEHKVNPFGSCLPILIQFPVLIALFYVVQTGLNPDNAYLLYPGFINVSLSNIHTNFFGILELTARNTLILPLIVGLLQFIQMKMTLKKAAPGAKKSEMEIANSMMIYVMPVMIALFTASVPAGVGLYWATSTLFGIGQQAYVNKQTGGSSGQDNNSAKRIITV